MKERCCRYVASDYKRQYAKNCHFLSESEIPWNWCTFLFAERFASLPVQWRYRLSDGQKLAFRMGSNQDASRDYPTVIHLPLIFTVTQLPPSSQAWISLSDSSSLDLSYSPHLLLQASSSASPIDLCPFIYSLQEAVFYHCVQLYIHLSSLVSLEKTV